jgi:hypothetical protein
MDLAELRALTLTNHMSFKRLFNPVPVGLKQPLYYMHVSVVSGDDVW